MNNAKTIVTQNPWSFYFMLWDATKGDYKKKESEIRMSKLIKSTSNTSTITNIPTTTNTQTIPTKETKTNLEKIVVKWQKTKEKLDETKKMELEMRNYIIKKINGQKTDIGTGTLTVKDSISYKILDEELLSDLERNTVTTLHRIKKEIHAPTLKYWMDKYNTEALIGVVEIKYGQQTLEFKEKK